MTNLTGYYIRVSPGDSAEVQVSRSTFHRFKYHVEGLSLWGERRPGGPNIGLLDFTSETSSNILEHSEPHGDRVYRIRLIFDGGKGLVIEEENWLGFWGMNVTFEGEYRKASAVFSIFRLAKWTARRLGKRVFGSKLNFLPPRALRSIRASFCKGSAGATTISVAPSVLGTVASSARSPSRGPDETEVC